MLHLPYYSISLTHPVPDVQEALLTGEVKHQQEAHGISKKCSGEAPEPARKAQREVLKVSSDTYG